MENLHQGQDPQPAQPKPPLPPELDFLKEFPRAEQLPRDQQLEWLRKQLALVRRHAPLLRQHGFDPDLMIARLQPALDRADATQKAVESAQDDLLHATANQADAIRTLVDALEVALIELRASNPFHPDLDEWEDMIEQLREDYPKLPPD